MSDQSLYKFMRYSNHSLQTLINSELYFPSLSQLNDPADSKVFVELFDKTVSEKDKSDAINRVFEHTEGSFFKKLAKSFSGNVDHLATELYRINAENYLGTISFFYKEKQLEDPKNWAHYADESRGFCLVFENSEDLIIDVGPVQDFRKKIVQYDLPKYKLQINEKLTELINGVKDIDLEYAFHKSKAWNTEDEYRIAISFKQFNYPQAIPNRYKAFNKNRLKAIYYGERMKDKEIDTLKKIVDLIGYKCEVREFSKRGIIS